MLASQSIVILTYSIRIANSRIELKLAFIAFRLQGVKDKSWETSMEEMRSEMSFAELAILHDLVYGELDAVAQDRKSSRKNSQLRSSKKKVSFFLCVVLINLTSLGDLLR